MRLLGSMAIPALGTMLLLGQPSSARAQTPWGDQPLAGERLVVTYDVDRNGPAVYQYRRTVDLEVQRIDGRYLFGWSHGAIVPIDLASIRSVKRQVGTKPPSAPAMVLGSAAGFAGGFLVGALAHTGTPSSTRSAVDDGLVAGVLIGAPLGAFVAWVTSRGRPIYEDVDLWDIVPSVAASPAGGVGLGLTIAAP
jgi:hypothetical protein